MIETRSVVGLLEREDEKPCALRRGELDERDRAICAAVWRFYDEHGCGPSLRHIGKMLNLSTSSINDRINQSYWRRPTYRSLVRAGWIAHGERYASYALRPGPRFVALEKSHGVAYPLEWSS